MNGLPQAQHRSPLTEPVQHVGWHLRDGKDKKIFNGLVMRSVQRGMFIDFILGIVYLYSQPSLHNSKLFDKVERAKRLLSKIWLKRLLCMICQLALQKRNGRFILFHSFAS